MTFLDRFKPVHSAHKDEGAEAPDMAVEDVKSYLSLLQAYVKKRRELHDYHRQTEKTYNDPEVSAFAGILNSEVTRWHDQLKEAGQKIGKGEYDVIVDIFRQEGNLSRQFGLSEFSLLTTDDTFLGQAGGEHFVPRGGNVPRRKLEEIHLNPGLDEANRFFTKDDALIVFEVVLYEGKGSYYDQWITYAPDSYSREHRARALAEKLNTRMMWFDDADPEGYFHAHSISLGGVVIEKKDIETTAALIREHPELYRLGKEFYTEEETKKNSEEFEKHLTEAYKAMGKYGNYEQNAKRFLARIRQVYGREHSKTAQEVYDRWLVTKRERDGY